MNSKNAILVVDDTPMNCDMLRRIFADDYVVFTAQDGKQALEQMHNHPIDLVLLDLAMPVMDGYQVIEAMKADADLANVPIVVETSLEGAAERRAFELGADDFITKPYDVFIIRRRVSNLIRKYVLQMENLRQALSQAEQLSRAKGEFLSHMSHELRSPINSVVSLATLLKEKADSPADIYDTSDKIIASSRYLLGVINDVLDMSAIESAKVTITRAPFDLRHQTEALASMFFSQCREKGIEFDLKLSDTVEEYLFGDPMHLKEILVNLLSNAIKFTPSGGHVLLRVSQVERVAAMVKMRFEVIDDGEGIDPANQERIFKPYTQEAADTAEKHGGSGLGLSITRNLVDLMGGTITVDSDKGSGATFTVELPFTVSKEIPKADYAHLKDVRALLIDDDQDTQEYGRKMMAKVGIECDSAYSGEEALRMMRKAYDQSKGYDACFIDWRMPGMSGIEVTRAIRSVFDDDTVIVVASAYDTTEIESDAKSAGADLVVPKPMFQSSVFDLLMEMSGGGYEGSDAKKYDYDFSNRNVLIADDNSLNAKVPASILLTVGCTSQRAANGSEACEMFESSEPGTYDAILMDIQMPLMSGLEASRHIRASAHPQAATIPIIAVTANAFTEDVRESRAAGMNDHIPKPIDTGRLLSSLDDLFESK